MFKQPGVKADSPEQLPAASALATRLQLPLHPDNADLLLIVTEQRLELRQTGKSTPGSIYADFVSGKAAHRRKYGGGRNMPLARAAGVKPGINPFIIDATAGLGQDAFVLASLGCKVTLLEQSPIIAALLQDALCRAEADDSTADIAERMQLFCTDACDYLSQLKNDQRPDVIYLDPMYPHKGKSALAKKEMRLFQQLLGLDETGEKLLKIARNTTLQRVVVKRPARGVRLGNQNPDATIRSPKTRYDLYFS